MKNTLFVLLAVMLCYTILSCENKNNKPGIAQPSQLPPVPIDSSKLDPPLDDSLMAFLNSLPQSADTSYSHTKLVKNGTPFDAYVYDDIRDARGGNGFVGGGFIAKFYSDILPFSSTEKLYYDLITNLSREAYYLQDRHNFQYGDSGIRKPSQNGLSYSWGRKQVLQREAPEDHCPDSVYGLDCSGYIYQVFRRSGVILPDGRADDQRKVATLRKALNKYFKDSTIYTVTDMGKLLAKEIISGDILYFRNISTGDVAHIGICLKNGDGKLTFFESRGNPGDCAKNMSMKRGAQSTVMDRRLETEGREYGVVRIAIVK